MSEPLGASWGALGRVIGVSEGPLGSSLGALRELLGHLWEPLGSTLASILRSREGPGAKTQHFRESLLFLSNIDDFKGLRHPKCTLRGCLGAYFEHAGA